MELGRSGRPMMMSAGAASLVTLAPISRARGGRSLRRALSPTFPAGEMVFFIPWRVVAEESGAAHFGFGGAMLLDLPGPALRLLTDVADLHFSDIAVRGDDGRSAPPRARVTAAASRPVTCLSLPPGLFAPVPGQGLIQFIR
jgi:hypothetical protein